MLALFSVLALGFVTALSGAMMPGPLLTATISESTRRGFLAGPLLMVGHAILEAALLLLLLWGLAPFFQSNTVFIVIALLGAAVLIWMATGMFRSLPTLRLSLTQTTKQKNNIILHGALMSIANPYWSIWWATIGIACLLKREHLGTWGVAAFFAGHILADFVWYSVVSAAVARGRRFLTDRMYRLIIGACAAILVGFAVYFVYSGIERLAVPPAADSYARSLAGSPLQQIASHVQHFADLDGAFLRTGKFARLADGHTPGAVNARGARLPVFKNATHELSAHLRVSAAVTPDVGCDGVLDAVARPAREQADAPLVQVGLAVSARAFHHIAPVGNRGGEIL